MLSYSLVTVRQVSSIDEVVITVPAGFENAARAEVAAAGLGVPVKIAPGGIERQDSVRIALELTSAESEIVIVHDAARPLSTPAIFEACIIAAARIGGAIAAIPVADTLKRVADGAINATVARAGLWQAQTPQAFRRDLLIAAHQRAVSRENRRNRRRRPGRAHRRARRGRRSLNREHQDHDAFRSGNRRSNHSRPQMSSRQREALTFCVILTTRATRAAGMASGQLRQHAKPVPVLSRCVQLRIRLHRLWLIPCPFDQFARLRPVPSRSGQVAVDENRIHRVEQIRLPRADV